MKQDEFIKEFNQKWGTDIKKLTDYDFSISSKELYDFTNHLLSKQVTPPDAEKEAVLKEADDTLALLEDVIKGSFGDDITKLRGKINKTLYKQGGK